MKKPIIYVTSGLFVVLIAVANYYGFKKHQNAMEEILSDNIEAVTSTESSDPITIEFCYMSKGNFGNRKPICVKGTTPNGSTGYPTGDIYPCKTSDNGAVFSKLGYCYKKKKK